MACAVAEMSRSAMRQRGERPASATAATIWRSCGQQQRRKVGHRRWLRPVAGGPGDALVRRWPRPDGRRRSVRPGLSHRWPSRRGGAVAMSGSVQSTTTDVSSRPADIYRLWSMTRSRSALDLNRAASRCGGPAAARARSSGLGYERPARALNRPQLGHGHAVAGDEKGLPGCYLVDDPSVVGAQLPLGDDPAGGSRRCHRSSGFPVITCAIRRT